jgi:small multidrug resistance family-3 protein
MLTSDACWQYGGVFIAGSLVWGMIADGFRPDRWDVAGAVVSLIGVGC